MMQFHFLITLGRICIFFVHGASADDADSVSVMEGDDVTLHTGAELRQQDRMTWFFGEYRIAGINGDQTKTCTDDECKERFRERLKRDQTGSLTITNINTADSGEYTLKIANRNTEKIFRVTVHDVFAAERDEIKRKSVMEGESVILDSCALKNSFEVMVWYFKEKLIAEITGDKSKICTDDECPERFRDRLKLDQTGCLTITNTRTTDSGEYTLHINSNRFSIITSFTIIVTYSGRSSFAAVTAAAAVVVLLLLIAALVFSKRQAVMKRDKKQSEAKGDDAGNQDNGQADALMQNGHNEDIAKTVSDNSLNNEREK